MAAPQRPKNYLPTVAFFLTILLVSVVLAVTTDLQSVLRTVIAVVAGGAAAGLTTAVVAKRS